MCWKSGVAGVGGWVSGWVEHLERIREEGGGWAEPRPTGGGTDEGGKKKKKPRQEELRKGNGSVSSLEHKDAAREKTLVPGSQERDAGRKTPAKKKFDLKKRGGRKGLYTAGCASHCSGMCTHSRTTMTSPC